MLDCRNPRAPAINLPLAFGFLAITGDIAFFGVRFLAGSFLALDGVFFRAFNVPFMPAWAIDNASLTSSTRFFTPISHHATAACLSLVPHESAFTSTKPQRRRGFRAARIVPRGLDRLVEFFPALSVQSGTFPARAIPACLCI